MNISPPPSTPLRENVIALANAFQVIQDDWIQLTPLGDFWNEGPVDRNGRRKFPNGVVQRIDVASVSEVIADFNSIRSRIGRLFGGSPWYIGHPDVAPELYPDKKAYGWIMELSNRGEHGLCARVKWTPEGEKLKEDGSYKYYSPAWGAEKIGEENGKAIMRPCHLISAGFTNTPNIPVMPLANEATCLAKTPANDPAHAAAHAAARTSRATRTRPPQTDPPCSAARVAAAALAKTFATQSTTQRYL